MTFRVREEVCSFADTMMDDERAMPHGFKIPFFGVIMRLIIGENEAPLVKSAWVDEGVIRGLRLGLIRFNNLERNARVLDDLFKCKK